MKEYILKKYEEGYENIVNSVPKEGDENYKEYLRYLLSGEGSEIEYILQKIEISKNSNLRSRNFIETLEFVELPEGEVVTLKAEIELRYEVTNTEYTGRGSYGIVIDQYEGIVYYDRKLKDDPHVLEKFFTEFAIGVFYGMQGEYYDRLLNTVSKLEETKCVKDKYDILSKIEEKNIDNIVNSMAKQYVEVEFRHSGITDYDRDFVPELDKDLVLYYVQQMIGDEVNGRTKKGIDW